MSSGNDQIGSLLVYPINNFLIDFAKAYLKRCFDPGSLDSLGHCLEPELRIFVCFLDNIGRVFIGAEHGTDRWNYMQNVEFRIIVSGQRRRMRQSSF
jgi:radical SAM superfamily enzyme YgiQ (UPF0313 family)